MDRKFRPDRLTGSLLIYSPIESYRVQLVFTSVFSSARWQRMKKLRSAVSENNN